MAGYAYNPTTEFLELRKSSREYLENLKSRADDLIQSGIYDFGVFKFQRIFCHCRNQSPSNGLE